MDSPMPSSLVEILDALEDPRVDRTKLHPLTDILVLSVLAVICGADSFVAIALFGQLNEAWLRTFLKLPHGIPSHDSWGGSSHGWMRAGSRRASGTGYRKPSS